MPGSIVLNLRGGARICVPRRLDWITPYVLLEQEDWFEDEIGLVRELLRPGERAVDIGANFGVYTLALARAVAPGPVWALEPAPATAEYLERSLSLGGLPGAVALRLAASDRDGSARFSARDQPELSAIAAAGDAGALEVRAASLDRLAAELAWDEIDFVKIDVEGHEPEVVAGGRGFFAARSPLVMLEISPGQGKDLRAVERLASLGYRCYRAVPGLGVLAPVGAGEPLDEFQLNLFCCKPDRARRLARAGRLVSEASAPPDSLAAPRGALACFRDAQDPARGADARYWLLQRALQCAEEEFDSDLALPGLMTYARIARDLGQRMAAFRACQHAGALVEPQWRAARAGEFLAPEPRFDAVPMEGDPRAWLECMLGEARLGLGVFSSFFAGTAQLGALEALQDNPFKSPLTVRRRQLVRMRAGLQQRPEPHPLLAEPSALNLNPGFWRGDA